MQYVSRAERGAPAPKRDFTNIDSTRGVKVHYEGTEVPAGLAAPDQHGQCAARVNAIEQSHLNHPTENYISIAYSAMVCPHGTVYEGRGLHHLQAANGPGLNSQHYSVCAMLGDSGLTEPTDAQLHGLRDAVEWFQRDGGAGPEIKGHRDGYATSCPGGPLYAWVQAGAPRPGSTAPAPRPTPSAAPSGPDWPGVYLRATTHHEAARIWQQRMRERGWPIDVDGWFGPASAETARRFQQDSTAHGWPLDADGVVGPATWAASWNRPIS
ncbi:hypothetical protein F4556_005173 [Kitasatospora gansuensis]|uniref:N-acetylmuramoyl-L-alanine amidase n=1 Tax=Kitasatospora gansuensis TaxID=258050 RepID=A0A7W7SFR2_9ACTN|nr:N-acetylmuramoyl-L-alanine amidase [Kitasatospora gansuensis]MBB4949638.1 hypothetical protein [Kitasatospora gansuensis]